VSDELSPNLSEKEKSLEMLPMTESDTAEVISSFNINVSM